ncbi:hypothetical protein Q1695_008115 [Nippostrongylus brasiliensis]|nr:hypothetical protein Q1695_008115 [Nippostrongylus brasiliensis]
MSVIIRLQLLPLSANAADVRAFFHGLRIPDGAVHIVGGDDGDAFIGFATDEDARQAMRRDRGQIHGEEVRLYLSSRAEMNDVITRAKAAALGLRVPSPTPAARAPEQPTPTVQPQEQIHQNWQEQTASQYAPVPAVPDNAPRPPSSFAPDPSEFNKPLYMRGPPQPQQPPPFTQRSQPPVQHTVDNGNHTHNGDYHGAQRGYPPPTSNYPPPQHNNRQMPPREDYGNRQMPPAREESHYEKKFPPREPKRFPEMPPKPPFHNRPESQQPIESSPRFFSAPPRNPNVNRGGPPGMPPPAMPPRGPPGFPNKDEGSRPGVDGGNHPPPLQRPPFGMPPGQNRGPPGQSPQNRSEENGDGQGFHQDRYNGPVSLQDRSGPGNAAPHVRKPLLSQAPMFNDGGSKGPMPPGPMPPGPMPPGSMPPGPMPPGNRGPPPPNLPMRPPQQPVPRAPLLGPNFGAAPTVPKPAALGPKYVELSRLPTEMLRPAVLEQFLKPSVPLQVSSVKVVYSSQGIHVNTLVRFDNPSDADSVLRRDGELGIRVRSTTKSAFDDAVDGLPPAVISATDTAHENKSDHKRDSENPPRRRSRSRDRRRNKRDPSPRKRPRSRSRSRDRRSARRSRSRSPKRPRPQGTTTKWCLQLTNVPFRCTEPELIEWMSERVRPTRVTRTFYADGNASDRWVAEFESESLLERAQGIKRLLMGRTVKMCRIEPALAEELMKIEDVYGERKKEDHDKQEREMGHMDIMHGRNEMESSAPVFFSAPPRGMSAFGRRGMSAMPNPGPPPPFRGRGGFQGFPPSYPPRDNGFRGRGRGGFGGRGGMREYDERPINPGRNDMDKPNDSQKMEAPAPRSPEPEPIAATDEFVASLGPRGTVISCCGFPSDVTMEDVLGFFHDYPVDHNSVRIRMGDDGIPTGECMLAMMNTESSSKAVSSLAGKKLRGQVVSLQLANP